MSRLRRIADCDRIFFVTTCLVRGVTPLFPAERDFVLSMLAEVRKFHDFLILGYVVMPDHAHLLTACRVDSISTVMHQWKFKTAYVIQKQRGAKGSLWQARYFDFICRRNRDVSDKLLYIHQNPVTAGLTHRGDEWPWSSAAFYAKTAVPPLVPDRALPPLVPDRMEFSGGPEELLWPAPCRRL